MRKKLSLYKSVKTDRGWRYCKAAFHSNAKVKPNIVLVGGVEEKHTEGAYFTLSANQWVAFGEDALDAQRKLMAMNAQREFQRLSQNPQQLEISVHAVSNGRRLTVAIEVNVDGLPVYIDVDGDPQIFEASDSYIKEWITCVRTQAEHEELILRYNMEDCVATHFVSKALMTGEARAYDEDQALNRGRFAVSTAHFEHNGIPVDVERFAAIRANAKKLQILIASTIEAQHNYGVYVIEGKETNNKNKPHAVWKMAKFVELLERNGITVDKKGAIWQATDSGDPILQGDYFETMCNAFPFLEPLRQTRKTIKTLGLFDTVHGHDGFNRYPLFPLGQRTSRNNPPATQFMLGRPHWMRMLITPKLGYAVVSADITGRSH